MKNSSCNGSWALAPRNPQLHRGEIHVWRADVDGATSFGRDFEASLSADEIERAQRFRFAKDRKRFLTRRGLVRQILSRYLEIAPSELAFSYGAHGKPELSTESHPRLFISASHSEGMALFAVARERCVGIDVERCPAAVDFMEIARSFFSPREFALLSRSPGDARNAAFVGMWTVKEAYVKATGIGLSFPLDQVEIGLSGATPTGILAIQQSEPEAAQWSLQQLVPQHRYLAAVVARGHDWQLRCLELPPR